MNIANTLKNRAKSGLWLLAALFSGLQIAIGSHLLPIRAWFGLMVVVTLCSAWFFTREDLGEQDA